MRQITLLLSMTCWVMPISAIAEERPYRAEPVSDKVLNAVVGTALPGLARTTRALSDANAQLYLQQVGATSRIAMDNWWSQTGAALVLNNALTAAAR